MATLEEVRDRLLKPAKDLADWNFPLAMILEEYYTLLQEHEDVNFSDAALVVQNSGLVYDRRVEYLYHGVSALNESFAEHEAQEIAQKEAKKSAKDRTALIDFGDFEPIHFTKFVGKNINAKARTGNKNAVKLLSQRFPQLENSRSSLPIEVYDIHGEVVGEKYNFRCNEYLTASGMLVEHLTPEDFLDQSPRQSANAPLTITASDMDLGSSFNPTREAVGGESVVQETDTGLLDTSFASSYDSGVGSSIQSSKVRPDSALSNFADSPWDLPQSRPESRLSTPDPNIVVEADLSSFDDLAVTVTPEKETVQNPEEISEEASQPKDSRLENSTRENQEETEDRVADEEVPCALNSIENTATQKIADKQASPRRSKRSRNKIDAENDSNAKSLLKLANSTAEFKAPCSIVVPKSKGKHRNRKTTPETERKRSLKRPSTTEDGGSPNKMKMYSPTRQLFHPLKKEELEDFEMSLEECYKNRPDLDVLHYEAVTDTPLDPSLDYRTTDQKSDQERIAHIEPADISKSDLAINENANETPENIGSTESIVDDFPMPDTPESSDSASEISPNTPPPTYRSRIEQSVRDIYQSADVRTAEEEAVLRWHEYMEPRLRETQRRIDRSPFNLKQYGARLVERIKAKSDGKIKFAEMVTNEEPAEVARYFLASLKLANDYTLHITTNESVEGNMSGLTLTVVDKGR